MSTIQQLLYDIPPVTRFFCIFSLSLSALTFLDIAWRFLTNLMYYGEFNLSTMLKILIFYRFSRKLEEHTFRGNSISYLFFLVLGIIILTITSSIYGIFLLSESLLTMIFYLWSRKNQNAQLHILGFFPLRAPYLCWFFVIINIILGESIFYDILGIIIGHFYYFLTDIYPKLPLSLGRKVLDPPPNFFVKVCRLLKIKENHIQQFQEQNAQDNNFIF